MSVLPDPDTLKGIPPEELRKFLSIYHALLTDLLDLDATYAGAMQRHCGRWTDRLEKLIERRAQTGSDIASDLIALDSEFAAGIGLIGRDWVTSCNELVARFRSEGSAIIELAGDAPPAVN